MIPVKNGVVVDFYFMKEIVDVDAEALTVTVQPGISWEKLDRMLKREGLTLRLYPSSYPSSTVGGWLGQGGAGYGSYAYNYFPENVVSRQGRVAERRGARVRRRRPGPARRRRGHDGLRQPR